MTGSLDSKVAIVTGGGKGIGRAAALLFAAEGAKVVVATRTAAPGQDAVDAIIAAGGEAFLIATTIDSRQTVKAVIDATVDRYGRLDIVLHNAAAMMASSIVDLDDAELDEILTVNLKSAFWFAAEGFAHLRRSGQGRLLFTSSITGNAQSHPNYAAYGTSKAGLNGFVRQAGYEFAADGVTVNGVAPGVTFTEGALAKLDAAQRALFATLIPRGQAGAPEDIAHVLLMLAQAGSQHVTGQTIIVDGGQSLGSAFPK